MGSVAAASPTVEDPPAGGEAPGPGGRSESGEAPNYFASVTLANSTVPAPAARSR